MPVSLTYMFVRMLLGALLLPSGRDDAAKELEIVVLRHQIGVLRRQAVGCENSDPGIYLLFRTHSWSRHDQEFSGASSFGHQHARERQP